MSLQKFFLLNFPSLKEYFKFSLSISKVVENILFYFTHSGSVIYVVFYIDFISLCMGGPGVPQV